MSMSEGLRPFDGVICLGGEDWWYHNRGHFDFQVMRRIARRWPVLFVNSLGVRMPTLERKGLFAERMWRKAKSVARGVVNVENEFWVVSPLAIPGALGARLSGRALAPQIRLAARLAGIRRPVLWVHCPAGAPLMRELSAAAIVMQRTDRFEAFPEGDPELLARQIREIKASADLVVYAAEHLADEERGEVKRSLVVSHGVELEAFVAAGETREAEPWDVAGLPRPRVGFIGGLDAHTFDPELFAGTVRRMPDVTFVMVGGSSLPEGWCTYPNVRFLGRKPYDEVARYMAAMDALIMPWNRSEWIQACNPIKLKEYLAVGRPVITTDFAALGPWRDLVRVAGDADAFATAIRAALEAPFDAVPARTRLRGEGWDTKADAIMEAITGLGLFYSPGDRARREPAVLTRRPAPLAGKP